jgi:uncharacterized protein (DUF2062 family)
MIGRFRAKLHELGRHLLSQHTAPGRLAAAVLVGVIVGCSPFFGLHFFICVALAWLLRLNQVVVYGAANISIPPMIPFLGFASVQLGNRLLHGHWLTLRVDDFAWKNAPQLARVFFVDWLVGGVVVGAAIGLVAGALTFRLLLRRQARLRDPLLAALHAARTRWDALHRRHWIYARLKLALDPAHRTIAPQIPPDTFTVDLGCGIGLLPILLALLGERRRALGIEWDGEKVRAGQHAAKELDGVEIVEGDVRTHPIPACDVITLVDMLHYYDADTQRALLARCRAALRPGGRILVREGDRQRTGGARWTRFVEGFSTRIGWNRGPEVRFRPIPELVTDLEALGFRVRADEVAGRLHPGNVLLIGEL